MLVKSEPQDYMSINEMTDLETALLQQELFGSSLPESTEIGCDDFLHSLSADIGVCESGDAWSSPPSSGSSTRSSSTIDDKMEAMELMTSPLCNPDLLGEMSALLSEDLTCGALLDKQPHLPMMQEGPLQQQQHEIHSFTVTTTSSNLLTSAPQPAPCHSAASLSTATTHSNLTKSSNTGGLSSVASGNSSPLLIKTEEHNSDPSEWYQLLASPPGAPAARRAALPTFTIVKRESRPSGPTVNSRVAPVTTKHSTIITTSSNNHTTQRSKNKILTFSTNTSFTTNSKSVNGVNCSTYSGSSIGTNSGNILTFNTTIKSSPPASPTEDLSPKGSPLQPLSPVSPAAASPPKFKVLSISAKKGSIPMVGRLQGGVVAKTKRIRPKVSLMSVLASSDAATAPSPVVSSIVTLGASSLNGNLMNGTGSVHHTSNSPLNASNGVLNNSCSRILNGSTLLNGTDCASVLKSSSPVSTDCNNVLSSVGCVVKSGSDASNDLPFSGGKVAISSKPASVATVRTLASAATTPTFGLSYLGSAGSTLLSGVCNNAALTQQAKVLKRHERMIKNRESASLSRKKKKEYVTNLESDVKKLTDENVKLKQEVSALSSLCTELQTENCTLRKRLVSCRSSTALLPAATSRAAAPLLLTVFCLFAFALPGRLSPPSPLSGVSVAGSSPLTSRSPQEAAAPVAPMRHLLWVPDDAPALNDSSLFFNSSMCPSVLNETESLRLESELRDWFHNKVNWEWPASGRHRPLPNDLSPRYKDSARSSRRGRGNRARLSKDQPRGSATDTAPASLADKAGDVTTNSKALSVARERLPSIYRRFLYHEPALTIEPSINSGNSVMTELLGGTSNEAPSLLEVLQSRPDSYYVVSLSRDLLLVPPQLHNTSSTSRPKMTLLLPAPVSSTNGTEGDTGVSMLQIDCEVLHTSLLSVASASRPADHHQPPSPVWEQPPSPRKAAHKDADDVTKPQGGSTRKQSRANASNSSALANSSSSENYTQQNAYTEHPFRSAYDNASDNYTRQEPYDEAAFQSSYTSEQLGTFGSIEHPYMLHARRASTAGLFADNDENEVHSPRLRVNKESGSVKRSKRKG